MDINIQHNLLDIIFLTLSAVLSGALAWEDIHIFGQEKIDWLKLHRPFENGIPSKDTIARVISSIKPDALNSAFLAWVNSIREVNGQPQLAIDGKTLRSSHDGDCRNALHSISVWCTESSLLLAQEKSTGKKNEQESVVELLDYLDIKNTIITVDAMNTQKKTAEKIIEKGADYILCVKNNHKIFRQEIEAYYHKIKRDDSNLIEVYQDSCRGHGRIETRICRHLEVSTWLAESIKWRGIKTVIELERTRENKRSGKVEKETQYYISSLSLDAQKVALAIRKHWEVENKVHWVLDVAFNEDAVRIHKGDGAENMGILRRFALNLVRQNLTKGSLKGKIKKSGWSDSFRTQIIFG